jgi:hypothetical protein
VFLSKVLNASKHLSRRDLPQKIGNGVRVVGWYSRCTLLSPGHKGGKERANRKYNAVCLEAEEAVCVPELDRKDIGLDGLDIYGPGGFKQTRVRYPFTSRGQYDSYFSDSSSWAARVIDYVDSYSDSGETGARYPDELAESRKYPEGLKKKVTVNAYERDELARKKCIEKYGYKCAVCCFDFHDAYGEIGNCFVHVHHLIPLHRVGEQYEVDPIKDLRPVCPNCHAMLHRGSEVLTIESLRKLLKPQFIHCKSSQ